MMEEETTIMGALSTLTPLQFSDLTRSILSLSRHHHRRLSYILSSPSLFSLTLQRLLSLSLHDKTLLIARHLLSLLHLLTLHLHPPLLHPSAASIKLRDLDSVLLLLFLCDTHQHDPEVLRGPPSGWRVVLGNLWFHTMFNNLCGIGVYNGGVLLPYIELVTRCLRFSGVMGGFEGKEGREVATACAAVVALPAVEVRDGDGMDCAVCKEEMREGRDVCELPCKHLFHWSCILPWLRKRNTCPSCRFHLPTDDVFGEIQRLWKTLIRASTGRSFNQDCT